MQPLGKINPSPFRSDHDLGNDMRGTGYDVIVWIEEAVALNGFLAPKIFIHSANVSARLKMERGVENIISMSNSRG
ncbi:cyclic-phosphate processing receiver domain-containing protein [Pseudomonas sp. RHF3.3-3]|uniref:cyclic-phosphate processing receiver domain-containing protein n=1 Tax=Pseudomonas sp. RHF3.3-3 TaxID=3396624 RepID=UPI003A85C2D9